MAETRKFVITPDKPFLLDPYEGEPFMVSLAGAPQQWRLTFGTTPAGDAIYFKDGFGPIEFIPDNLRGLIEGDSYDANAQVVSGENVRVLATGRFTKRPSITGPAGPGTYFLINAQAFRSLTQGEYDGLAGSYDPDTIYLIEETPGRIVRIYRGEYLHRDDVVQVGNDWTPVLTASEDGTIVTLSADSELVVSAEYILQTVSDPVGTLYSTTLPIVLQGVTVADEPKVSRPPKFAELFPPLEFLGLEPITATALADEIIFVQLAGSVDGGKEPYEFTDPTLGTITGTALEIPQAVFDGEVNFTITDARNKSITGFLEVTIEPGGTDIVATLTPSMSPLHEGQTIADVEFYADKTALENFTNAASITVTFQGAATDASTVLMQGDSAGFTVIPVDYLGTPKPYATGLSVTQYDVRQTETSDGKAFVEVNSLVADDRVLTLEIVDNDEPRYNGSYTFTKADLAGGPYMLVSPFIPDYEQAAVGDVLTLEKGLWLSEFPLTYSYVWYRHDQIIEGATTDTYEVVDADAGVAVSGVIIANDGVNPPNYEASAGVNITAAEVSSIVMTPYNNGVVTSSTTTNNVPFTATFATGAAEAGKYLFINFIAGDTGSGSTTFSRDGTLITPWIIHTFNQMRLSVVRVDASAGGDISLLISPSSSWRGYSYRAWIGTGGPEPVDVARDTDEAYGLLDVSAIFNAGDLIYGMAAQMSKGTTGDLLVSGLTEDAGIANQGTKRHEYYSGVAEQTGTKTITVQPTGDGVGDVGALIWKVV